METNRASAPNGIFELVVEPGWITETDEETEGLEVARDEGNGALHLLGVPQPPDSFPDPAEELYSFLEEQGIELEEDEVEDFELAGGAELALCEYLTEEEDEPGTAGATFWLVAVATAPGALVFGTYECPAGAEDDEREPVRAMLRSLRLQAGAG